MDKRKFIYRIDAEDRIVFLNQEWLEFAGENDAPELTAETVLGRPLESFITGWETRHLYELLYARVRRTGREIRLPFNCDSPTMRRSFRLHLVPLANEMLEFNVEVTGLLPTPARPLLDRRSAHSAETVVICSWCKQLRSEPYGWRPIEEMPEAEKYFRDPPPSLTHDICPDCLAAIRHQLETTRD